MSNIEDYKCNMSVSELRNIREEKEIEAIDNNRNWSEWSTQDLKKELKEIKIHLKDESFNQSKDYLKERKQWYNDMAQIKKELKVR